MQTEYKIGLIGSYGGRPLNIYLPVIGENELLTKKETKGHCFYTYDLAHTVISLFSNRSDGTKRTAKIDVRSSCIPHSNLSLYVVKMNDGALYLRTYIDAAHNGLYPLCFT